MALTAIPINPRVWRRQELSATNSSGNRIFPMPADHPDSPFDELNVYEVAQGVRQDAFAIKCIHMFFSTSQLLPTCLLCLQMGRLRARQHVNPLVRVHQQPAPPLDSSVFEDPKRPLVVDLGCAAGRFLLLMARRQIQAQQRQQEQQSGQDLPSPSGSDAATPSSHAGPGATAPLRNFLGIELRKPVRLMGLWQASLLMPLLSSVAPSWPVDLHAHMSRCVSCLS